VRGFNHLIDQGKAFYWGTSEWNPEEIAAAWRVAERLNLIGPLMEQPQYNMITRDRVEREYAMLYEHYGTGLTVFSPLKQGVLSGKYNDSIPEDSRLALATDAYTVAARGRYGDETWQRDIAMTKTLKVGYSR